MLLPRILLLPLLPLLLLLTPATPTQGFILDGFPRNVAQAQGLDKMLEPAKVQSVVNLKIDDKLLVSRITGRLIHKASGRSYHTEFNAPKVMTPEPLDDVTGEPLMRRSDDTEESLMVRLGEYHKQTVPVLSHYSGVVTNVDAAKSMGDVWSAVKKATA